MFWEAVLAVVPRHQSSPLRNDDRVLQHNKQ